MSNISFYKDLPYIEDFINFPDKVPLREVPRDWHVLIADINNSTIEVEEGRYMEVNFISACTITSIMNINKKMDLPFIFGGDGATILVPSELLSFAEDALRDTKNFAKQALNIDMRIASIPVIDIHRSKHLIKVGKLKVAEDYLQPIFAGGGVDYAEYLAKKDFKYAIKDIPPKYRANYSGLKCIWQSIPGKKEEVLNVLVKATVRENHQSLVYKMVLKEIETIFGSKNNRFPLENQTIKNKFSVKRLYLESALKSYQNKIDIKHTFMQVVVVNYIKYIFKSLFSPFTKALTKTAPSVYIESTDSEKFDDMLRMVIATTKEEREKFQEFLEDMYKNKLLAYGLHINHNVQMTCLIFQRSGRQVHFIDGSDGGYTFAAKELKNKVKLQKSYL